MTETVEELQAQLVALNKARASGVTSTVYEANGTRRTVTYKSDIEMRNAQWDLQQRIAAPQTDGTRRTVLVATNKGFRRRRSLDGWLATDAEKQQFERDHRDD
jgi:hypothetical protein